MNATRTYPRGDCAICRIRRPRGKLTVSRFWTGCGIPPEWAIVHPGCDHRTKWRRHGYAMRVGRLLDR